jgi:RHS repeat-associated protein
VLSARALLTPRHRWRKRLRVRWRASGRSFPYNLRFPGQIFGGPAGLHQNDFRDYDPAVGRYVESDPIGLNGGINTFGYVRESPIDSIDPLGLFLWPWEIPVSVDGGTDYQRAAVNADIAKILNTPRGREMEEQIRGPWYWHGSPKTVHLNCNENDGGEVGGDNLFIDPNFRPKILTNLGLLPASLDRIIAHELGHTLGAHDDGVDQMNNVRLNENPVAIALGEPVRVQY